MLKFGILCTILCTFTSTFAQVGTFWQITDVHLEVNYLRTGDIKNDCRGTNISEYQLGAFGDFNCDAPLKLVQNAVDNMKAIQPNPDFILWPGDTFPHLDSNDYDWDMVFTTINKVTSIITSAFPNTPLVPVIGNHDTSPDVNFPWDKFNNISTDFLIDNGWSTLIPQDQHDNFIKGGYYSMKINPKLTILVLNTLLYETPNHGDDPNDQFNWFKQQLQSAENNSVNIIITSHIAPGCRESGSSLLASPYVEKYLQLINDYSEVIITQIYGHLHHDTFNLAYDDNRILKSSAFLASSITPWKYPRNAVRGNNPEIRLYKYSASSGEILDYDQYFLDLLEANKNADEGEEAKPWTLLYRATELYNVSNLNLTSMEEIFKKIRCNDDVFKKYYKMYYTNVEFECDQECRENKICLIVALTSKQWSDCKSNSSWSC